MILRLYRNSLVNIKYTYNSIKTDKNIFLKLFFISRYLFLKFFNKSIGFNSLYIFKRQVGTSISRINLEDVCFDEATQNELDLILKLNSDKPFNYIIIRLENNETCYVARDKQDKLLAYMWAAPGVKTFGYRSAKITIGEREVYLRDALTLPENRGKGIFTCFLNWVDYRLNAKGYTCAWVAVNGFNYSSINAIRKAGFNMDRKYIFSRLPFLKCICRN